MQILQECGWMFVFQCKKLSTCPGCNAAVAPKTHKIDSETVETVSNTLDNPERRRSSHRKPNKNVVFFCNPYSLEHRGSQDVREMKEGADAALHVAQLVGDGEGGAQPVVLADAAAPVWIAHRPQLGQAWSDNASVGQSRGRDCLGCLRQKTLT